MDFILDQEDFRPKIEERSDDLFESKDGKLELEVHRIFTTGGGIGVVKNQNVKSVFDLTHLAQVRNNNPQWKQNSTEGYPLPTPRVIRVHPLTLALGAPHTLRRMIAGAPLTLVGAVLGLTRQC